MTEIPSGFLPIDRAAGPFGASTGPFYVRTADNRYGVRLRDAHMNLNNVAHGGMLMTFTDHMLGYAVLDAIQGEPCATMALNVEIIRAGLPGDWIEGLPEMVRITRSVVFVRGTLYRGSEVVLTASGVWKRLGRG